MPPKITVRSRCLCVSAVSWAAISCRKALGVWFSTVTDHCLFVNHRGQRAGDYTLVWLAREMSRGNVRLVEPDHGSIVDRAWKAIVATLRSFTGSADTKAVPAT